MILWILLNCTAFVSCTLDLAELHSFRLVYFKHKEIFLVVCIVSDGSSVLSMPVYRLSLIWSPATRLVNRDRSDKGGPCRLHRAFSYTNWTYSLQDKTLLQMPCSTQYQTLHTVKMSLNGKYLSLF